MDNDRTQQMPKVKVSSTTTEEMPKSFLREATLDLLIYATMIAAIGALIIGIGYGIIEYAWPSLRRAFTHPVDTGIVMVAVGTISFYAGAYLKRRRT
jgi:hypothetical protein